MIIVRQYSTDIRRKDYDDVVERTGCVEAEDTLACLRTVEYDAFQAAIDASPTLFDYQVCVLIANIAATYVTYSPSTLHGCRELTMFSSQIIPNILCNRERWRRFPSSQVRFGFQ